MVRVARSATTARLVILLLLLSAAGLSIWLTRALRTATVAPSQPIKAAHTPDYYLTSFVATVMDAGGRPHHRLDAARLVHYADDGTAELERPRLTVYRESPEQWDVAAESGWVSGDGDEVLLGGEVEIHQTDAVDPDSTLVVLTSELRVFLEEEYAETDEPVTIRTSFGSASGVGMRVFLERGRLQLLSQAKGTYVPPAE